LTGPYFDHSSFFLYHAILYGKNQSSKYLNKRDRWRQSGRCPETQPSSPQGGDTLVRFIDVGKTSDGEALAARDLNLDLHKGGFITLLGPSGSGKTTTLMMLAGFETPTHGDILLSGRTLRNVPPPRCNIGVVLQNYALFSHMAVVEIPPSRLPHGGAPR
jgi:putative spermidine/putrescine transport system ATP-binding protein